MIPHNRGRGRGNYPNRGRGGPPNYGSRPIIIQHGSKQLIAANLTSSSSTSSAFPKQSDPLYEEFMEFMKTKQGNTPYLKAVTEEESEDTAEYIQTPHKELIITVEYQDIMRYFESGEDVWGLMSRYLDTASYAAQTYKPRSFYENILSTTGSCEINHFKSKTDTNVYVFSKVIIKHVITAEEWGLSTLREREYVHPQSKVVVKYNYWDYIESFNKAFLYENPQKKHTWFFKVCPKVYNQQKPNWFIKWWYLYGPSVDILPDPFKGLYKEWRNIAPKMKDELSKYGGSKEVIVSLHFFIEFSVPWILKWVPEVIYSDDALPCIKRTFYTKFWRKMLQKDPQTGVIDSQETVDHIKNALVQYKKQNDFLKKQENPSHFHLIEEKLRSQGKINVSKEDIIKAYIQEMKEEILMNTEWGKSDSSMHTVSDEEEFLAGESQPVEDITSDDIFEEIEDTILKSIKDKEESSRKGKEKET